MNKQQLAAKIWASANKMRSKIEANEYKDYILGFIFYKFLSDKEVQYLKANDWTDEYLPELTEKDQEVVENVKKNIGYFIAYEHLFSTWIAEGKDFSAGNVTTALSAFSRNINDAHKKVFVGIFKTLETGLSKLGETSGTRTKAILDLLYLIKDIPMDGRQDYDVLGFIYEYLISNFAANAGKKAGEFYTPHEVSLLMSEIVASHLKDRKEIKIYDPTSGSGSLLINIGKSVARYSGSSDHIKYYAQEIKENTYNLTRMNLVMRGILPDNIVTRNGDTLEEDWPYFDDNDRVNTYNPLYVDAVVSNPPYSQAWNPGGKEDSKKNDPRYSRFGLAPKGKADYAFLLHDLYHLKPDGIMNIVLPHGVLFRGGEEGVIRQNLIEQNHIDAIIGLPANIFFGTGIPTIIVVLRQKRQNTDVLIVDASRGFAKQGKNNVLRACDIKKIVDVVTSRTTQEGFSRLVSREEIRANDYNLNIPRYIDSTEVAGTHDLWATMFGGIPNRELDTLSALWAACPALRTALLIPLNEDYSRLREPSIRDIMAQHPDILAFKQRHAAALETFPDLLREHLISSWASVNIAREESRLGDELFTCLSAVPLIDPYEAYQLLDEHWREIATDLEMLQTEGFDAARQVDPRMVIKIKKGKEEEEQDGWKGHILPFELVQEALMPTELAALRAGEARLAAIADDLQSLADDVDEEEREKPFFKEGSFVAAEIGKALKAKTAESETLALLQKVQTLLLEEKDLKKKIRMDAAALHLETKALIEQLDDEQVRKLLEQKWITPLQRELQDLSGKILERYRTRLESLGKKYEVTFADVDRRINETEKELAVLLGELTGADFDMQGIHELQKLLGEK